MWKEVLDFKTGINGKGKDKGKFNVGYDKNGEPTKKWSEVVGKGGVDYQMLMMRFQVAF